MFSILTRLVGIGRPIGIVAIAVVLSMSAYYALAEGLRLKPVWHEGPISVDLES